MPKMKGYSMKGGGWTMGTKMMGGTGKSHMAAVRGRHRKKVKKGKGY